MHASRSLAVLAGLLALLPARAADKPELADGDRVVFLGNTLIEREPRYGYWETALTVAYPERDITFRNLGWSGDTVWGEARARFGNQAEGFRHLKDHVFALKPTVIILGYGLNESFEGPAGLPRFQKGLDALLDTLGPTKARIIMLSPLKQEDMGRPLPDPAEQNKNIRLYSDALKETASKRGHAFIDLFDLAGGKEKLTDNGIHLTAHGYWRTGLELSKAFGSEPTVLDLDAKGAASFTWKSDQQRLPYPASPGANGRAGGTAVVRVKGLAPGKYKLQAEGVSLSATVEEWAKGVPVVAATDLEQVEKLRSLIIDKNQTYFHRWRPQNETYLFLFRKGEQGQNAKEIPQFDPLVEKLENEIAKLKKPVEREYKLVADKP